jgi:adenylate kinase family enzyme
MTSASNTLKQWIFINGPSGAGKTTAVCTLEDRYGYRALKVGPYFRAKADSLQDSSLRIAMALRSPVPSHYIEQYICEHAALDGKVFLVDGLPRDEDDIMLIDELAPLYFCPVYVSIRISFGASVDRVRRRSVCVKCGTVGKTAVCSGCGSSTVLRSDDSQMDMRILRERYDAMQCVVHTLSQEHKVYIVDGSKSTDEVANDVQGAIRLASCY